MSLIMVPNFLLILAVSVSCVSTQSITLQHFSYADNKTSCINVIISGYDVVEFTCVVDYSQEPDIKYVIFETKKAFDSRFIFLTDCNIQESCKDSLIAKGRPLSQNLIEITIRLNATTSLNGAKLRGLLYTPENKEITSGEKPFPNITDLKEIKSKLIVNGKIITPPTECHDVLLQSELNIVFLCEIQSLPCLIEISTDDSNETRQGVGHATWNKQYPYQREVNVSIKYAVCNLNQHSKTVSCKFKIAVQEYKSSTDENSIINNPITLTLLLFLGMMMILLCVMLFKKKICRHFLGTQTLENFMESSVNNGEERALTKVKKKPDDDFGTDVVRDPQNLMQDFKSCLKEENHKSFIPIDKFSTCNLPPMFGTTDLFYLIKCIAKLTVKVTVTDISANRPKFYPGTSDPYPFYEKIGDNFERSGTGLVKNVIRMKNEQTCPCYKCLRSDNASKKWGKICISTSKSSVFDDSEAQETTFKIHFGEESGKYQYVKGLNVTQSEIHADQCEVECVTCDKALLKELYSKLNDCMQKMAKFNSKYNKLKDKDKLTIIVSHPHGCPKHVSIGHWTNRQVVGEDVLRQYTKYVYTTPTCPGCTGAFVYILGASDIDLKHHVHCGVYDKMKTSSSTGMEKKCTETL